MGDFWEHCDLVIDIELLREYLDSVESFLEARQKELAEESEELESRRQALLKKIKSSERLDEEEEWEQLQNDYQLIVGGEEFCSELILKMAELPFRSSLHLL